MARFIFAFALCVVAGGASAAPSASSDRLWGEALAYFDACPAAWAKPVEFLGWGKGIGADLAYLETSDKKPPETVLAGFLPTKARLNSMSVSAVCSEAFDLYGPQGKVAKGLIQRIGH